MIAAEDKSLLDLLGILRVWKTANVTITSDSTVNSDADLKLNLTGGTPYLLLGHYWFTSDAAADIKYTYTYSGTVATGSPKIMAHWLSNTAGTITNRMITSFGTEGGAGTTTGLDFAWFHHGWIETVNPGVLQFQWSQQTSDVNNTTLYLGSVMMAIPLG